MFSAHGFDKHSFISAKGEKLLNSVKKPPGYKPRVHYRDLCYMEQDPCRVISHRSNLIYFKISLHDRDTLNTFTVTVEKDLFS